MAQSTTRKVRRRSPGEGSVYQDGSRWRGAVTWTEPDGTRQVRTVRAATAAEARTKLDDLRRQLHLGTLAPAGASPTVEDFLTGWIERHRHRVRPSTWRVAEQYVRCYLIPTLGRIMLSRLSAADVERALASFVSKGRLATADCPKPRPVSPVTASHVRAVLRRALSDAQRAGVVGRNAASDATPPHVPHRAIRYLTAAQVRHLLDVTADDPLGPLYALAATTGLRRGELLGLRWPDVSDGNLTVRRSIARDASGGWSAAETKSARSRRTLPLSRIARRALDTQRARQQAAQAEAGTAWQDRTRYVFTDAVGRSLLPEYVSHRFSRARVLAGIPEATFHDLRHSAATLMLAEGVPLAVISEWLGHSGIAVTVEHYAAVVPQLRREAADAMDRALGGES